jgi:hypothetical protein
MMAGEIKVDTFRIILRHRDQPLDSPSCTICELYDGVSLAEARAIFRDHFLQFADDEIIVELFRDQQEVLH